MRRNDCPHTGEHICTNMYETKWAKLNLWFTMQFRSLRLQKFKSLTEHIPAVQNSKFKSCWSFIYSEPCKMCWIHHNQPNEKLCQLMNIITVLVLTISKRLRLHSHVLNKHITAVWWFWRLAHKCAVYQQTEWTESGKIVESDLLDKWTSNF